MTGFALAVISFVGLHWLLSSRPVRTPLLRRLGAGGFSGLYSAVVGAAFVAMLLTYSSAGYVPVYTPPAWGRWAAVLAMPLATFFLVAGFTTKSPTAAGQAAALADPDAARGLLRVTRHPALWGFTLWGLGHLAANGDARSIWLFGGMVALSLVGMLHIDHRRRLDHGDAWEAFARRTSVIPFAAILTGRQRLILRELGLVRPLASLAVLALLIAIHEWLVGVSPLP